MAKAPASKPQHVAAAHERPATDPPTMPDGLCFVCIGPRPPLAVTHDDPFCSSACCRDHYGIPLEGGRSGR